MFGKVDSCIDIPVVIIGCVVWDVNIRNMPWLPWVCYNSFLVSCIPRQYPRFMKSPVSSDPWGPKHLYTE